MDLRLIPGADPTPAERDAVDALLGSPTSRWEGAEQKSASEGHAGQSGRAARDRRHLLLPALQAAQARAGWISPGALNYVCQRLTVPPAEAFGVASFYALLSTEPQPPFVAHVCDDLACRVSGAQELCADLERRLGPADHPAPGARAMWKKSPCLGMCERAPAVFVQRAGERPQDLSMAPATTGAILDVLAGPGAAANLAGTPQASPAPARRNGSPHAPQTEAPDRDRLRLLRRIGHVDPESLDDYRAHGGYAALRRAFDLGPEGVVREVIDSKLMGRGGAAFPTGRKWDAVARAAARPHYMVCNADESEPGTFKDRVLMEEDPFALIEAMTIAGYATACDRGFLYVRGEYPLAAARLQSAIVQTRARGLLGAGRHGDGSRLRYRDPARGGCVHLRRGDGPLQLDRGAARRAAQQAAVPGAGGALRQADAGEQCGDARERARHRAARRAGVRGRGHRAVERAEALLSVGVAWRGPACTR